MIAFNRILITCVCGSPLGYRSRPVCIYYIFARDIYSRPVSPREYRNWEALVMVYSVVQYRSSV